MSKKVIQVEGVSKRYRIGQRVRADTFAEQIKNTLMYPIRNFRRIANLTSFKEEDATIFWALQEVNFEVNEGEVLGIIGHNGAGKSTLLKILSRITEPTRGRIEIQGRVSALLEVGTGFHPELTGRDNIYMNGTILGMRKKEIDRKLDEIISFSGIDQHIDTPVKFYSSGMTVRLAFSVAAHLEPEILIIDEVLAVGDAEFQKKCLGKMESVAGEGRTVLFVSHNMGAVSTLCSRALLLKGGSKVYDGSTLDTINRYLKVNQDLISSQRKVKIEDHHRKTRYSKELEFHEVELLDEDSKGLSSKGSIDIRMTFKKNPHFRKKARIGGSIYSNDQSVLGTFFTEEILSPDKTGNYLTAQLSIRNHNLSKGFYHMSLSVGTGNERTGRHEYDVVYNIISFEIIYSDEAKNYMYSEWMNNWGNINFSDTQLKQL